MSNNNIRSATRKEELLIDEADLNRIWILRKVLSPLSEVEAIFCRLIIQKNIPKRASWPD